MKKKTLTGEVKKSIPFPTFKYRIEVVFTDNLISTANNFVSQGLLQADHGIDNTTSAFHIRYKNRSSSFIILKYSCGVDDIVHEGYHAICQMFRWVGAEHEEEVFAYHLGYLVGIIKQDQEKLLKKT